MSLAKFNRSAQNKSLDADLFWLPSHGMFNYLFQGICSWIIILTNAVLIILG
jgi:hypothetical protein